ncbi:SCO family protein [Candidatus Deferrimicrobium sp.]|uniref:SCO family protein n=1 Tax=Candidatus Deferrimicrobium sp. TaxID=3060586 RepID=UPI00271E322A|nr:SCO family protein [Candidatus Deferrimicrobium sp.]MDO8737937.1 SCO family protein [Candidatus Deferrimicrobium sp.]
MKHPLLRGVLLCVLLTLFPATALAADPQDAILQEVGVDEKLGAAIPRDLPFTDASGKPVRPADYLGAGPVLLTLNYYTCPMLCPLTFRSLAATMAQVKGFSLARDYRVVTVSIDPDEIPEIARAKANETHALMPEVREGDARWPFLYGSADSIRRLAESVGYRYRKVGKEFAHPAVTIVLSPGGTVSRYLYGIEIDPRDLKLALIEASEGKIGASSAGNALLMYCFKYDPVGKKYMLYARNIMKAAGAVTLVLLAGLVAFLWRRYGRTAGPLGKGE